MRARFFPSVSAWPMPPCMSRRDAKPQISIMTPIGSTQPIRRSRQKVFSMRPRED